MTYSLLLALPFIQVKHISSTSQKIRNIITITTIGLIVRTEAAVELEDLYKVKVNLEVTLIEVSTEAIIKNTKKNLYYNRRNTTIIVR